MVGAGSLRAATLDNEDRAVTFQPLSLLRILWANSREWQLFGWDVSSSLKFQGALSSLFLQM